MKSVRKIGVCIMLLVLLGIIPVFAGGAQEKSDDGVVKLQFASWMVAEASGGEEIIPAKIAEWEAAHPGVEVEVVPLGWEETPDKIIQQTIAKNMPDIFTIESLWLGKFEGMPNCVEDLSSYMDAGFTSELIPAYKSGIMNGRTAGLLWSPNPMFIVYNKELAAKAGVSGTPKSLEDWVSQAEKISALGDDIYGLGLQLGIDEYSADFFHILAWMKGADLLDASGKPVVDSAEMADTVDLVKSLVDRKIVPFGEEVRNLRTMFAQGKLGFFIEGPWIAGILDAEGMSRDEWGAAAVPGNVSPCSHLLCMSAQTENKDLAWDLMKYIVSEESLTSEYFKGTGLLPVVAYQYDNAIYNDEPTRIALEAMSNLKNPNVWQSQKKYEIEIAFMEVVQKILLNDDDIGSSLSALNEDIAEIISE